MITVKELIDKLQVFPANWNVEVCESQSDYCSGDIVGIEEARTVSCDYRGNPYSKNLQIVLITFES